MINRHFLKPMLKSQLLRHAAIFARPLLVVAGCLLRVHLGGTPDQRFLAGWIFGRDARQGGELRGNWRGAGSSQSSSQGNVVGSVASGHNASGQGQD